MQSPQHAPWQCEQCGSEFTLPPLTHRQRALCPRCGAQITAYRQHDALLALAFAYSAVIFLILSLPFTFLTFKASGQHHTIDLPGGLSVLIEQDYFSLAFITALATLILPAIVLIGLITLLSSYHSHRHRPWLRHVLHWVDLMLPWSMAEIFLVATLVALVKITDMADLSFGLSFFAFVLFTICSACCSVYYDRTRMTLWVYQGEVPHHPQPEAVERSRSIQQTWALLITASILYIPANVLPIMRTEFLGREEANTILSGVIALWHAGSYPVAIIILVASVIIPVAKLGILMWLNFTVSRSISAPASVRIKYYRFIEWIGRWSMIDVYVVAILVALVQLGKTVSIYPGPAALAFSAVVFITMLAAMTFDSRLIWQQDTPLTHE